MLRSERSVGCVNHDLRLESTFLHKAKIKPVILRLDACLASSPGRLVNACTWAKTYSLTPHDPCVPYIKSVFNISFFNGRTSSCSFTRSGLGETGSEQ